MDQPSREITFEGCFNFRDLGGYGTSDGRRIRWRRLFRSDHSALLSEDDCGRMERDLGIVTLLDLRAPARASDAPSRLGVKCVKLPLLSDEAETQTRSRSDAHAFMREIREGAAETIIADIFAVLADELSYPLVFHCITGKDRAGLIAALVLGVLGVADEDIVRDYAMTEPNMARTIARLRERGRLPADGSFTKEIPRSFFETPPAAMISLLQELRERYGSIRAYVTSCGVETATLEGLEHQLLTNAESN